MGVILGSQQMLNSDIIQVVANGTSSAYFDMHGLGEFAPVLDYSPDLSGSYTQNNGQIVFKLTRDLDTLDFDDYLLDLNRRVDCAWAINRLTPNFKTQHTARGSFGFYLKDDSVGRSFSLDPNNPDQIPLLEFDPQVNYDTDGTAILLPTGPLPVEPQTDYYFFNVPTLQAVKSGIDLIII